MGPMRLALLGGLSFLSISAYLQLASSQDAECTASSEDGFDYQVQADTDFVFHWTVNETSEEISFQVEYAGTAYVSVGFSPDGAMVGSDAVIGLPDDDTVWEYSLTGRMLASVNPTDDQELSNTSIIQTGTYTVMTFTRPLAPSGSGKYTLSPEEGEEAIFIWAYGPDNTLDVHASQGFVTLTDILCSDTVTLEEEDDDTTQEEEEDDDTTEEGDDDTTQEEEEDDDTTEEEEEDDDTTEEEEEDDDTTELSPAGRGCESSDPDYEIEFSPTSDLTIFYSVDESMGTISVKAVYQGDAWVGIGFSDDQFMPGSDAIVGRPDDGTALEYDMPGRSTPTEANVQEVTDATVSQIGGVTTLTFTRPLEPEDEGKQVLALQSTTYWLYAWGQAPFDQHDGRGASSVTLGTCGFDSAGNSTTEEDVHGWLMALSWAFFFPIGIIFARFSPDFKTVGFRAHWMLQSVGALLAFAGFITALYFTEDLERDHFDSNHAKLGLFLFIFLAFQVAGAVFRPSSPSSPVISAEEGLTLPPKPTMTRRVWSVLHRGLGYVAVVLGVLNCFTGLEKLEAADKWTTVLIAVVAVLVVLFVVLQLIALVRPKPRAIPSPERTRQALQTGLS